MVLVIESLQYPAYGEEANDLDNVKHKHALFFSLSKGATWSIPYLGDIQKVHARSVFSTRDPVDSHDQDNSGKSS